MGYAFISYSSKNQTAADTIKHLFRKNGINTWMAPNDIPAGSKYAQVINQALKNCSCLVLLLTNDSQDSTWVAKEVERAISYKKVIIPMKLEDVELNDEFEFYLGTDHIVAIKKIENDNEEIQNVLSSVIVHTGKDLLSDTDNEVSVETPIKSSDENITQHNQCPRNINITIWSPVNINVYLNDKNHFVLRVDHNSGFDYMSNSISVCNSFKLIFCSKGFEKTVAFDNVLTDTLEYYVNAIVSQEEIVASYDREEALSQLRTHPTAYAFTQLIYVGQEKDIDMLSYHLKSFLNSDESNKHTDYIVAKCILAMCSLCIKFKSFKYFSLITSVCENYNKKNSYMHIYDEQLKRFVKLAQKSIMPVAEDKGKDLTYCYCKDWQDDNLNSYRFEIPEIYTGISEHALDALYVRKIYIPSTVTSIHKRSFLKLGSKTEIIYISSDNRSFTPGHNGLINNLTGEIIPIPNRIKLATY